MTNREIILGRIREALKVPAPPPIFREGAVRRYDGVEGFSSPESRAGVPPAPPTKLADKIGRADALAGQARRLPYTGGTSIQQWLPPVGQILEEQIELFRRNVEDLKAEFHECANLNEAGQHVKNLATAGGWKRIGRHSGELTDAIARELNLAEVKTDVGYAVKDLESCDAGLTECEVLVAQTGSVLVSAPSAGGRALSVLPPHHVVLARRHQMVPDLTAALRRVQEKFKDKFPSFLSFISGPSRTGDIERILVLGAHGPKKLTILLLP